MPAPEIALETTGTNPKIGEWPSIQAQINAGFLALFTDKASLNSPTFTGTVGGITKAMVGLPNVDIDGPFRSDENTEVEMGNGPELIVRDRLGFGWAFSLPQYYQSITTLGRAQDSAGLPAFGPMLGGTLGRTRGKLRQLRAGVSGVALRIGFFGDSWLERELSRKLVADTLFAQGGTGGIGFVRLGGASSGASSVRYHMLPAGEMVTVTYTGTWTGESRTATSVNTASLTSETAGDRLRVSGSDATLMGDPALLYIPATGAAQYRWNDGTWRALDTSTGAVLALTTDQPVSGAWTLDIEVVSGSVTTVGVDFGGGDGVTLDHLAYGNTDTEDFLDAWTTATAGAQVTALGLDCALISLGTNDIEALSGIDAAQFASNLTAMFARLRTLSPGIEIAFVAPCENFRPIGTTGGDNLIEMSVFIDAARLACWQSRVAFHSYQDGFGAPGTYADLFSDDQHPDASIGGPIMADVQLHIITGA